MTFARASATLASAMRILPKLILALTSVLAVVPATAGSLYVVNGFGQFGTVDVSTGAFQQIGPAMPLGSQGLVPGPGGSLLSLDFSGNLLSINTATGVSTLIGPTGLADCSFPPDSPCGPHSSNSLAAVNGRLFVTDFDNNLYNIDPLTGATTLLGPTGIPPIPFTPAVFNPDGSFNYFDEALFGANGNLYATFDAGTFNPLTLAGTEVIPGSLYRINPDSGVATLIGPTHFNLGAAAALNGAYYAFDDGRSKIVSLDLSTGATVDVGDFDPAAGIVTGAASVPEPASTTLAALGLAALVFTGWRRRSYCPELRADADPMP
jgi:hypothetical protein